MKWQIFCRKFNTGVFNLKQMQLPNYVLHLKSYSVQNIKYVYPKFSKKNWIIYQMKYHIQNFYKYSKSDQINSLLRQSFLLIFHTFCVSTVAMHTTYCIPTLFNYE